MPVKVTCPVCGSNDVKYGTMHVKLLKKDGSYQDMKCNKCSHEWQRDI